ncbi:MAG: HEAT repeat domain-containing protein [Deltaproteobacteria bacterium]|nr:HEAT repeat domain-containing protein [Deltaproteobacteria bacterium]
MRGLRGIAIFVACCLFIPRPAVADRVDDLVRQLRSDPDYKVRLSAALNLGKIGDKRAVPPLVDALKDGDKTVRGVASAALGRLVDGTVDATHRNRAISELERVAKNDPDAFVRGQAQKSFDSLKGLGGGAKLGEGTKGVYVEVGPMADTSKQGGSGILLAMRQAVENALKKKAPSYSTRWPGGKSPTKAELSKAGTHAAFYVDGTLTKVDVKKTGNMAEVSCKISLVLATYPEKSMFGFASGAAAVEAEASDKDIDEAKRECVGAVLEDMVANKVVPTMQQRVP